MKQLIVR